MQREIILIWVTEGSELDSRPTFEHTSQPPASAVPGRWVDARDLLAGDILMVMSVRKGASVSE